MKCSVQNDISFRRKLHDSEIAEYNSVLQQAKEKVGNKGHSMLIVPSSSLPHSLNNNTGCGNMLNKESIEFFDFAKQYWGINYVQLMPEGVPHYYAEEIRPYSGSSLDLGVQLINLDLLKDKSYGSLLTESDIQQVIDANKNSNKDTRINYENTLPKDSPTEKALRKAFDELLKDDSQEKNNLVDDIEKYCNENENWLERKSIFQALVRKNGNYDYKSWSDQEKNLFNTDIVPENERRRIIYELRSNSEYGKEASYYMFKQYLADRHLAEAKANLNNKGIKLSGDMPIGCSYDEVWMFPKAFHNDGKLPWNLNAINFDTQEGIDFIKMKARNFAKRYDGTRVDASWLYINQKINGADRKGIEYGDKILKIIENEFKKVKGNDFDLQNITHEFEASGEDFSIMDRLWLRKEVENRVKIYKSNYLSEDWGAVNAYKKRHWNEGSYMLGATNHDTVTIKDLYKNEAQREYQINALSEFLKIPKEKLKSLSEFIKAKFAEPIRCFHNMFFFADALNLEGNYKETLPNVEQYRLKIPSNYQDNYFASLEKGEGLNIMDALEKAFVADGLDKTEPELYNKIIKYRDILNGTEKPEHGFSGKTKWLAVAGAGAVLIITAALLIIKSNHNKDSVKKQN